MNLFKSAVAAVAVAGAGYLGYKAVKSEKAKVIARATGEVVLAVATAKTKAVPKPAPDVVVMATVPVQDVVVEKRVVEVEANKPFEGAMSVAAAVQDKPRRTLAVVHDKGVKVIQEKTVAKQLKPLNINDDKKARQAAGL